MRGFSLIEIIITIALFGVLAGFGLFMSMGALRGAYHRSERDTIVSVLQKARSRAMANIDESRHGVCLDALSSSYRIVCESATCARAVEDEIDANTQSVVVTGLPACDDPIYFEQLSGDVVDAKPTELEVLVTQDGRSPEKISINYAGTILW